jgi:hypothetical protein
VLLDHRRGGGCGVWWRGRGGWARIVLLVYIYGVCDFVLGGTLIYIYRMLHT